VAASASGGGRGELLLPVTGDDVRPIVVDATPTGASTDLVDTFTLTFSEPLDPAFVVPANFAVTGRTVVGRDRGGRGGHDHGGRVGGRGRWRRGALGVVHDPRRERQPARRRLGGRARHLALRLRRGGPGGDGARVWRGHAGLAADPA
jgi:hypothetical protein